MSASRFGPGDSQPVRAIPGSSRDRGLARRQFVDDRPTEVLHKPEPALKNVLLKAHELLRGGPATLPKTFSMHQQIADSQRLVITNDVLPRQVLAASLELQIDRRIVTTAPVDELLGMVDRVVDAKPLRLSVQWILDDRELAVLFGEPAVYLGNLVLQGHGHRGGRNRKLFQAQQRWHENDRHHLASRPKPREQLLGTESAQNRQAEDRHHVDPARAANGVEARSVVVGQAVQPFRPEGHEEREDEHPHV